MRLRKPMKLGEASESWLRHEGLVWAWTASTWRYLGGSRRRDLDLLRVVLPLPLLALLLLRGGSTSPAADLRCLDAELGEVDSRPVAVAADIVLVLSCGLGKRKRCCAGTRAKKHSGVVKREGKKGTRGNDGMATGDGWAPGQIELGQRCVVRGAWCV